MTTHQSPTKERRNEHRLGCDVLHLKSCPLEIKNAFEIQTSELVRRDLARPIALEIGLVMTGAAEIDKKSATGGSAGTSANSGSKSQKGHKAGWIAAAALGLLLIGAAGAAWFFYDQSGRQQTTLNDVLKQISSRTQVVASDRNASAAEIAFLSELGARASEHSTASLDSARMMFALAAMLRRPDQAAEVERLMAAGSKLYASLGIANGELAGRYWTDLTNGMRAAQEKAEVKDSDAARTAYVAAADAGAKLVAIDPDNIDFQRARVNAAMEAGDARFAAQDMEGAKAEFEAALTSLDAILTDPESIEALRKRAAARGRLGDIAAKADNHEEALTHYTAALGHAEAAAKTDSNVRLQRDVWSFLIRSGDQSAAAGNPTEAKAKYQRAALLAATITTEPSGERYRGDTLTSQIKLGDIARTTKDAEGARTAYLRALDIGRSILATEPTDVRTTRTVITALYRLGDLASQSGDRASAGRLYAEGIATATVAASAMPDNTQLQSDLNSGKTRQERLSRQQ